MHILENDILKITIKNKGAELTSIFNKQLNKEILWQPDGVYWSRQSPVLFPIVGMLKNNKYTFDNKEYIMSQHGFARDKEFILVSNEDNKAIFELKSDQDTLLLYPFKFTLRIIYTLTNKSLEVAYEVINNSSTEMIYSIGAHPAFNFDIFNNNVDLKVDDKDTFEYHLLEKGLLNKNKTNSIKLTNNKFQLQKKHLINDALIQCDIDYKTISLIDNDNNYSLSMTIKNMKDFGVWTMMEAPYICLEPWNGHADTIESNNNLEDKIGTMRLKPNEKEICSFVIEINKI